MKIINSFKFFVLCSAIAGFAFTSCDDDDDNDNEVSAVYVGEYPGTLNLSGEWQGQTMFNGDTEGEFVISNAKDSLVDITVPEIDDFDAGRSVYDVDAFVITDVTVTADGDGYVFTKESFEVEGVKCDIGGAGDKEYLTTGSLTGTYKDGILTVNYDFTLGSMPFPLVGSFEGKISK